jgi:hypothetical protein
MMVIWYTKLRLGQHKRFARKRKGTVAAARVLPAVLGFCDAVPHKRSCLQNSCNKSILNFGIPKNG